MSKRVTVILPTDMDAASLHAFELDADQGAALGIVPQPGYPTPFSRAQASGAIPNTTRIVKVFAEPGDTRPVGATGIVLGSISHPAQGLAYFVEWDALPGLAVFVVAKKIARSLAP